MKTVYDPIHGFVSINPLEAAWLKSTWFLRLQSIHQLGAAYRVFPGAKHTRFEHSLGVMHLASRIFDHLSFHTPFLPSKTKEFYRQLLRIAALAHDIGHLPFSHTAESLVLKDLCHEAWTIKIIESKNVKDFLKPLIEEGEHLGLDALDLIKKIAIGEKKFRKYCLDIPFSPEETILSHLVTGDFFGADRMDYLLRDAKASGLSYGLFDHEQLIMSLLVENDPMTKKPSLMIDQKGIQACESLLVARYFMYQRLYMNPKVQAASYPMSHIVKKVIDENNGLESVDTYLSLSDIEVLNYARKNIFNDPNWLKEYEALSVTDEQFQALKNKLPLADSLVFLKSVDRSSFFNPNFKVKTPLGAIAFNQVAKLQVPAVQENFVLFESELIANVLGVINEANCS